MTQVHWERSLYKIGKVIPWHRRRLQQINKASKIKVSKVLTTVYMSKCRCRKAALCRRLGIIKGNKVFLERKVKLHTR